MNLLSELQSFASAAVALRRRLHACPELGFHLPETMGLIRRELTGWGVGFSSLGRGALAVNFGPKTGDGILLRADCDALAGTEESGLSFASRNGRMHACGHDLHTAILLGLVPFLKEREASLSRPLRLLFQPAEETLEGALDAVNAGVCEGMTEAYMFHVTVGSDLPVGTVILPPAGVTAPSADFFEIEVQGKGCHGADPASGIDPLAAAARILLTLEHLPAREIPSSERAVLTVGSFQGGESHNVLPNRAFLKGTVRCYGEGLRKTLQERIRAVSDGVGLAHGTKTRVNFSSGCPSLCNDGALRQRAFDRLSSLLGDRFFAVPPSADRGTAGSEDFAVISRRVPSVMMALSAGGGGGFPLHHPKVVFDEECILYGMAAFASLALGT
ncbi:MAG: amidohydrolase [Clostridia bacterium]|nr:amidohydrolase [Clostridia bacterium]